MSGASSSGAPPPTGVVQNSALSFVASAQVMQTEVENVVSLPPGNLQEIQQPSEEASQAGK